MSQKILRPPAAAIYVGLSKSTLDKLRCTGGDSPPFVKLTKRAVGYLQTDLDAWLANRSRKSTSQI